MGGQAGSVESNLFKDAYFTHPDDVTWCLNKLRDIYGLDGKTALEPAAGSNVFPKAAPELQWTTNELFPEFSQGETHDFHIDFDRGDRSCLGQYDFVIGNPPYGRASAVARKFVLNALEHSNVVAMVLPKALRRYSLWDAYFPDDCKVVVDEVLPNGTFDLPDGQTKEVGTFFLVLERVPGYSRGQMLDDGPIGYDGEMREFRPKKHDKDKWWPEWATHGICLWGSSGTFFGRERTKTFALTVMCRFTAEQADIVRQIDWTPIIERTKTSTPMVSSKEAFTVINRALGTSDTWPVPIEKLA